MVPITQFNYRMVNTCRQHSNASVFPTVAPHTGVCGSVYWWLISILTSIV